MMAMRLSPMSTTVLHGSGARGRAAKTECAFLWSFESANEGHLDKICDQVSDAVLDTCLTLDSKSEVACVTATKDNMVMVAGEIMTQAKIDYEEVVRGVVGKIRFDWMTWMSAPGTRASCSAMSMMRWMIVCF